MILTKTTDCVIIKSIITPQEKQILLNWAEEQFLLNKLPPNPRGAQRFYAKYTQLDSIPSEYWLVRDRVLKILQICKYSEEPTYKCFLGCNLSGGEVHPHRDSAPMGKWHVRCNLMLSKPIQGGQPIIKGQPLELQEGDLWAFIPSQVVHWSSRVEGERKRFICSYGFLVNRASSLLDHLLPKQVRLRYLTFQGL